MTKEQVKAVWDYLQSLLDIDGDVWMGMFTGLVLVRMMGVPLFHWLPISPSEAATYASAVTAFAYSNRGPRT